jgi:protein-disulfide isomerase-like protein with CxxC motif
MKRYHRREFVVQALAVCGTTAAARVVLLASGRPQSAADAGQAARVASDYFGGRTEGARVVGSAYLRQLGVDTGRAAVLDAARTATTVIGQASSSNEAVEALLVAIQRDYREGRSVQVEGWVLAQIEVEICVLTLLPIAA